MLFFLLVIIFVLNMQEKTENCTQKGRKDVGNRRDEIKLKERIEKLEKRQLVIDKRIQHEYSDQIEQLKDRFRNQLRRFQSKNEEYVNRVREQIEKQMKMNKKIIRDETISLIEKYFRQSQGKKEIYIFNKNYDLNQQIPCINKPRRQLDQGQVKHKNKYQSMYQYLLDFDQKQQRELIQKKNQQQIQSLIEKSKKESLQMFKALIQIKLSEERQFLKDFLAHEKQERLKLLLEERKQVHKKVIKLEQKMHFSLNKEKYKLQKILDELNSFKIQFEEMIKIPDERSQVKIDRIKIEKDIQGLEKVNLKAVKKQVDIVSPFSEIFTNNERTIRLDKQMRSQDGNGEWAQILFERAIQNANILKMRVHLKKVKRSIRMGVLERVNIGQGEFSIGENCLIYDDDLENAKMRESLQEGVEIGMKVDRKEGLINLFHYSQDQFQYTTYCSILQEHHRYFFPYIQLRDQGDTISVFFE